MLLRKKPKLLLICILGFHLFLLANLQFTAWPEMLSYPYLVNHGYALNLDFIHPYPPALTFMLAASYLLFGYGLAVLKTHTWLTILATDILVFVLARKIAQSTEAGLTATFWYVLTQSFLEGNMLWFDLAIVPWVLGGTVVLLNLSKKKYLPKHLIVAGVAFGVASLIKQTAGLFIVFTAAWVLVTRKSAKQAVIFLSAPSLLWIVYLVKLVNERALVANMNWLFVYPFTFWSKFPGYVQMGVTGTALLVLTILLVIPVFAQFVTRQKSKQVDTSLLWLMLIGSLISVYPRFSFFHLQLAIALVAVFASLLVSKRYVPLWTVFALVFGLRVVQPVSALEWGKSARFYSPSDLELAQNINKKVGETKVIQLVGLGSQQYVFTNTLPPKPWSDNFGWYLEAPGVQDWVLLGWEQDKPKFVITTQPANGNWYDLAVYRPTKIAGWIKDNYTLEDVIEPGVSVLKLAK